MDKIKNFAQDIKEYSFPDFILAIHQADDCSSCRSHRNIGIMALAVGMFWGKYGFIAGLLIAGLIALYHYLFRVYAKKNE